MNTYLKVPCEMAQFALRENKVPQVKAYLASQFIYSGKARVSDQPVQKIASFLKVSDATAYRAIDWLLSRDWIGRDRQNHWIFFRGLNYVHQMEGWQFARATILQSKDFKHFKAYLAGSAIAGLVKTKKQGVQTEQKRRCKRQDRSEQLHSPVSLTSIQKVLDVSKSTAFRLRKLADKHGYIKSTQNLVQITNVTPNELKLMKVHDVSTFPVELLGYSDKRIVPLDRIKYSKDKLLLQEPNMIYSLIQFKERRGLSKYCPVVSP